MMNQTKTPTPAPTKAQMPEGDNPAKRESIAKSQGRNRKVGRTLINMGLENRDL